MDEQLNFTPPENEQDELLSDIPAAVTAGTEEHTETVAAPCPAAGRGAGKAPQGSARYLRFGRRCFYGCAYPAFYPDRQFYLRHKVDLPAGE